MPDNDEYHMKVSRIPWEPAAYILDGSDYIFGMILELPEMYFVTPSRTMAFIYIVGRGMIKLHHDFTFYDDSEVALFVYHLRRRYEVK
jgi:hypothetical protein